jgi:hypothetical protein
MCAAAHRRFVSWRKLLWRRKGCRREEGAIMTMIRTQAAADTNEFSGLEHRFPRFAILAAAVVASQIASTVLMLIAQG